ncbi:MAG: zinc ribbon domain-containing protein [Thermacetogeniaceae bacterium]
MGGHGFQAFTIFHDHAFLKPEKCSHCGAVKPMITLDIRSWQCPVCKAIHNRDRNAAKNILNEGLRILAA